MKTYFVIEAKGKDKKYNGWYAVETAESVIKLISPNNFSQGKFKGIVEPSAVWKTKNDFNVAQDGIILVPVLFFDRLFDYVDYFDVNPKNAMPDISEGFSGFIPYYPQQAINFYVGHSFQHTEAISRIKRNGKQYIYVNWGEDEVSYILEESLNKENLYMLIENGQFVGWLLQKEAENYKTSLRKNLDNYR